MTHEANLPDRPKEFLPLSLDPKKIAALVAENLGDTAEINALDLQAIRLPTAAGGKWEMPEGEMVGSFQAIVMSWNNCRSYWPGAYKGGTPPVCTSVDGIEGVGSPGGKCGTCQFAKWDSKGKGKGQACKAGRRLFLMRPGQLLPTLLSLPPTCLKPCQRYFLRLTSAQLPYYGVVTDFSLLPDKNADGTDYSVVDFSVVRELDAKEAAAVRVMAESMQGLFAMPVQEPVVVDVSEGD